MKQTKTQNQKQILVSVTFQISIRLVGREGKEKTRKGVSFLESSRCDVGSSELCHIFPGDRIRGKLWLKSRRKTNEQTNY